MHRILVILLTALVLLFTDGAVSAGDDEPFLRRLILPKDQLPEGCTLFDFPKDLVKGKDLKNPCIIADADTLAKLPSNRRLFEGVAPKAMLIAVYQENSKDLGVYAWRFESDKTAEAFLETLSKRFPNSRRVRLYRTGPFVIWLWRDPGISDDCFRAFEMFLDRAVKEREKK